MSETATVPVYTSTTVGDWTSESNIESAESMAENLGASDPVKEAAKTLGEKGGKASAEKRAKGSGDADSGGQADGESAASTADDSGEPDSEGDKRPLGKPRDDPKARMLEATRKEAEAKRELRAERERTAALEQQLAEARKARAATPADERSVGPSAQAQEDGNDPEPKEADFDDYNKYVQASARWAARQENAKIQAMGQVRVQAERWAQGVDRANRAFMDRVNKVKTADPEFISKVSDDVWDRLVPSFTLEGTRPTQYNHMADEVLMSDLGPQLLLYFSEHPDEFQRIAALTSGPAITRAIAKVESKLEAATAGTSPKLQSSTAKPPIRPVTGAPSAVVPDDEQDLDSFLSRKVARR